MIWWSLRTVRISPSVWLLTTVMLKTYHDSHTCVAQFHWKDLGSSVVWNWWHIRSAAWSDWSASTCTCVEPILIAGIWVLVILAQTFGWPLLHGLCQPVNLNLLVMLTCSGGTEKFWANACTGWVSCWVFVFTNTWNILASVGPLKLLIQYSQVKFHVLHLSLVQI